MSYDEHLISMAGGDGEPDLDQIQARADAATEGPWAANAGCIRQERSWRDPSAIVVDYDGERPSIPNAVFIAHARTDVPALLALVREQQARIERVEAVATYLDECSAKWAEGETAKSSVAARIRAALTATEGA